MSYARFSTDDFRCDVYVYESDEGFVIHVATNRANITEEQYATLPPNPAGLVTNEDIQVFIRRNNALSQLVSNAEHIPIEQALAGETFVLETPGEAADQLEELIKEGFRVPKTALSELREEQRECSSAH